MTLDRDEWEKAALEYFQEEILLQLPPTEGEFTKRDLQRLLALEGIKLTVKACGDRMAKYVQEGRATQRVWRDRGHNTLVYKWVKDS